VETGVHIHSLKGPFRHSARGIRTNRIHDKFTAVFTLRAVPYDYANCNPRTSNTPWIMRKRCVLLPQLSTVVRSRTIPRSSRVYLMTPDICGHLRYLRSPCVRIMSYGHMRCGHAQYRALSECVLKLNYTTFFTGFFLCLLLFIICFPGLLLWWSHTGSTHRTWIPAHHVCLQHQIRQVCYQLYSRYEYFFSFSFSDIY